MYDAVKDWDWDIFTGDTIPANIIKFFLVTTYDDDGNASNTNVFINSKLLNLKINRILGA